MTKTGLVCSIASVVPYNTSDYVSTTASDSTTWTTVWTTTTTTVPYAAYVAIQSAASTTYPISTSQGSVPIETVRSTTTIGCSANTVTSWSTVTSITVRLTSFIGKPLLSLPPPPQARNNEWKIRRRVPSALVDSTLGRGRQYLRVSLLGRIHVQPYKEQSHK